MTELSTDEYRMAGIIDRDMSPNVSTPGEVEDPAESTVIRSPPCPVLDAPLHPSYVTLPDDIGDASPPYVPGSPVALLPLNVTTPLKLGNYEITFPTATRPPSPETPIQSPYQRIESPQSPSQQSSYTPSQGVSPRGEAYRWDFEENISPRQPRWDVRVEARREKHARTVARLKSYQMGRYHSGPRPHDRKHARSAYQPGVIFSTAHHTQYTQSHEPENIRTSLTRTDAFGVICTKYRKMIVVKCNDSSNFCTVLPIYTHNGQGIAGQSPTAQAAHYSIRDVKDPRPEESEGPNGTIYCSRNPPGPSLCVYGRSSVYVTEILSHRFSDYAVIEGQLHHEDELEALLNVFKRIHL